MGKIDHGVEEESERKEDEGATWLPSYFPVKQGKNPTLPFIVSENPLAAQP